MALADFWGDGEGFADDLFAATPDFAGVAGRFDLREAARGVGVGEGTTTGWPGLDTSDVAVPRAGSGSLKT